MSGEDRKLKRRRAITWGGIVLGIAALLYLGIPTADIAPADSQAQMATDQILRIDSSPLAAISMIAVYVDDQQALLEYNLGSGSLVRDLGLKPGQEVRVEATITSIIGVHRQYSSSFTTVEPLVVSEVLLDGSRVSPGDRIPPQPNLVFAFNRPVAEASVTLDNGESYPLEIDSDNPLQAHLQPMNFLKQGSPCVFRVTATGTDNSAIEEPQQIRAMVVKPLNLYGRAEAGDGGEVKIELDANVPFADVEAVRQALSTSIPDASVTVEPQKILITASDLSGGDEYTVTINNAEGANGSLLEGPLTLTLTYSAGQAGMTGSTGSYVYRGYSYTSEEAASRQNPAGSLPSGPPPGWPSCCPWPPR